MTDTEQLNELDKKLLIAIKAASDAQRYPAPYVFIHAIEALSEAIKALRKELDQG